MSDNSSENIERTNEMNSITYSSYERYILSSELITCQIEKKSIIIDYLKNGFTKIRSNLANNNKKKSYSKKDILRKNITK